VRFGKTIPILRIFDEAKAREFYVNFVGFNVDWEHRFEPGLPLYMQVSKNGCVLHLSGHHGDCSPGAALRVEQATSTRSTPYWHRSATSTLDQESKKCHGAHVICL